MNKLLENTAEELRDYLDQGLFSEACSMLHMERVDCVPADGGSSALMLRCLLKLLYAHRGQGVLASVFTLRTLTLTRAEVVRAL